ncbi:MAG: hypothetical protein MJZ01_03905 [Bacteroidales bacterium]|nr:hypothetical protein [Bacteroidales bacterium]
MRNDIFNIQRYWKYQKHVVVQAWVPLAITYGIFALLCIAAAIAGTINHIVVIASSLIAMASVIAGCWPSFGKKWHLRELLIPASNLEKYVSRLVVFFIIPAIIALVIPELFEMKDSDTLWHMQIIFFVSWVLAILAKRSAIFIPSLLGLMTQRVDSLYEALGNYGVLVTVLVAIVCIVGGYFCMCRTSLTLSDWQRQ